MTIGIGLLCDDGVVLASDRQITNPGGFKYEERKVFSSQSKTYTVTFSYAGNPDAAEMMFRRVKDSMREIAAQSGVFYSDVAKTVLEKTYSCKYSKGLQTLVGMCVGHHQPPFLLKTFNNTVVDGYSESIGFGDSSALRYLSDFALASNLTAMEGEILACYMVSVANRFIDGCSGGPDRATIHSDGNVSHGRGGIFPNQKERFAHCEEQIGKALRELLFSGGTRSVITQPLTPQK